MSLTSFNAAPEQEAVTTMLACCASHRFAAAMVAAGLMRQRPPR